MEIQGSKCSLIPAANPFSMEGSPFEGVGQSLSSFQFVVIKTFTLLSDGSNHPTVPLAKSFSGFRELVIQDTVPC